MLVRPAEPKDVSRIFDLIKELALYEKAPEQVTNTVEILHHDFAIKSSFYLFWLFLLGVIGYVVFVLP